MGPDPAVVAVRRAVRGDLAGLAGARVLVAVSGGADSLALAAAVAHEAPRGGLQAGLVTVDHGLQPGSADRAGDVVAVGHRLGLAPALGVTVCVAAGGGPEDAARRARYAALDRVATEQGAAAVLLGHTRDDQAETVLLGLARGSGARSLAGMPARRGLLRRPLLGLPRTTTMAACAALGLTPWEDPHNADPSFARSRARHGALPALEAALGPGVAAALARSADLLRDDADALDGWAAEVLDRVGGRPAVSDLDALPRAVRTRVLHRLALSCGVPAGSLGAAHVQALDALVTAWRGQGPVALPGGWGGVRRHGRLLVLPAAEVRRSGDS